VSFTLAPAFIIPYMTALSKDIEKPLFLRRFHVPYWGLTYVYGRNDMYWCRFKLSLGRFNIVGTTVKKAELLPQDLLADDKHTQHRDEKQYIAMTVAKECILGAEITELASEAYLGEAYCVFAQKSKEINPSYRPDSVNTDVWAATQKAGNICFTVSLLYYVFFMLLSRVILLEHCLTRSGVTAHRAANFPLSGRQTNRGRDSNTFVPKRKDS
jgi:hypothetical protein